MPYRSRLWPISTSVLLLLVLLLVACAPRGAPATDPATGTDGRDEQESGQPPPADTVTLRWRTRPDNQAEIDVYRSISEMLDKEFEEITLVYEPGGSESSTYQDQLKTELASGTAPDVFWIPGTDIADFAKRGLILDLRPLAKEDESYQDSDFYPGPMYHLTYNPESGESGEALWGLPRDVSTFVLYLNLDLIEEAGVADPRQLAKEGKWNWDTFLQTAIAIDALGEEIRGYGQNAWWGPYGYWIGAAGGSFFNQDRTACALDTPEAMRGLEFQYRMYNEYDVAVPYGEDAEPPFLAGNVGMFQNGRWATPGVRSAAGFNWDVVELPEGPAGPSNWLFWGAYVVNARSEHPEEAWALVRALTRADVQGQISELGANIPSRVSEEAVEAFLTFTPPENNQAFINGLTQDPQTEGPLWKGNWPKFDQVVAPTITALFNGEESLESFAERICAEADQTFAEE